MPLTRTSSDRPGAFWRFITFFLRPFCLITFRMRIIGHENIPMSGPVIIAANHASYADPPVIGISVMPRVIRYMAKDSLFRVPVLGSIIRGLYTFPVSRGEGDRKAITTALAELEAGGCLGIFPQGGRRHDGSMELNPGVAMLAEKSRAPVIPTVIVGSHKIWRGGLLPIRLPRITVSFGAPIDYSLIRMEHGSVKASRQAFLSLLTERLLSQIAVLESNINEK